MPSCPLVRESLTTGTRVSAAVPTVSPRYSGAIDSCALIVPAATVVLKRRTGCVEYVALKANVEGDRKSTRLNSSHTVISYAVFCLKKKKRDVAMPARQLRVRPL